MGCCGSTKNNKSEEEEHRAKVEQMSVSSSDIVHAQDDAAQDANSESTLYRQRLMGLNVSKLQGMCIAKKLYVDGGGQKGPLVDALVNAHYGSNAYTDKGSITINKSQKHKPGLSKDEIVIPPAELLVEGYIRMHIKLHKSTYPQALTRVFCEFLDDIWVIPEKFNGVMKRNGTVIFRPPFAPTTLKKIRPRNHHLGPTEDDEEENIDMIIGYSHGYVRGILNFEVKCIQPSKDAIGIMSEIEECEKLQWIAATKGNSYYYTSGSGIYSGKGTVNSPNEQYIFDEMWDIGDTIKMCVDLDNSLLSFYKNGEKVGKAINIEPGCRYHPVLATSEDMCEYELIL